MEGINGVIFSHRWLFW